MILPRHKTAQILVGTIAALLAAQSARATIYYFDVNGTTDWLRRRPMLAVTVGVVAFWASENTGTAATRARDWSSGSNEADFVATGDAGSNAFTVNLAGTTYVGAITVNSGNPTIAVGSKNFVLGASSTWTIATGSTLNVTGSGGAWGALNLNGSTLTIAGGGNMNVAGLGNSSAGLNMNGTGTLTISAADNFAGATTINSGTVSLTALSATGTGAPATELKSSAVTINAGGTLSADSTTSGQNSHQLASLTLNGGTLASNGVAGNSDYNFAFASGSTITAGNSTTSTISASIGLQNTVTFSVGGGSTLNITGDVGNWEGQAWGTINKTGAGKLSLTYGGNGYGGLTLNAGTVSVGPGSFGNSASGLSLADFEGSSTLQWGGTGNTFDVSGGKMKIADGVTATLDTNGNTVTLGTAIVVGTNKTGGLTLNDSAATPGTLTLAAAETYTGTTTIIKGTLQIGNGGTTGSLASTSIVDNANLAYSLNNTKTLSLLSAGLSGSGNLTATAGVIQFNGNITLGGSQSFTGNTTTSAYFKGLEVLANTTLTASSISLTGDLGGPSTPSTLSLDTSAANGPINLNISVGRNGIFYPLGGFTANAGTGALTISGSYTNGYGFYAGATSLTGALFISATNLLPNGSLTLHATAASTISGNVTLGAPTNTINVDNGVGMTVSGILTGGGDGITMTGSGTLALSNANTYTGATTIGGGTLSTGTTGAFANGGSSSFIGQSASAATNMVLSGGVLQDASTGAPETTDRLFTLTASSSLDASGANSLTFTSTGSIANTATAPQTFTLTGSGAGVLNPKLIDSTGAGTPALSVTKSGNGTWTLSNANTYTGATLVSAGTLALSGSGSVNGSSGITVNGSNATFLQSSGTAVSPTLTLTSGTLTGSGAVNTVNVGAGTGAIISNNNGVAGASLSIGTLTFNGGATVNTFISSPAVAPIVTGTLSTNLAGTVTINPTAPAGAWINGATYNLISYGGGSIGGAGFGQFALGAVTGLAQRQTAGSLVDSGSAITLTISGDTPVWSGAGGATWTTAATGSNTGPNNWVLLSGQTATNFWAGDAIQFNDTYNLGPGPVTVTNSSVSITGGNVSPLNVIFNNNAVAYTVSSGDGSVIAGSGSLTVSGSNTVTISSANTYTGGTSVNAGMLILSGSGTLGASASALTMGGGTLDLGGSSQTVGAVSITAAAASGNTIQNGSLTGTSYAVSNTSGNAIIFADLLANGSAGFTMSGAGGTVTLSGANTYTGGTTISAGILKVGSATALGGNSSAVSVTSGAVLDLNGESMTGTNALTLNGTGISSGGALTNSNATPGTYAGLVALGSDSSIIASGGNITLSNTGTITGSGFGLTVGGASNTTIASVIGTGAGTLTKQDAGTLTLSGANTYTGGTTVNGGRLVFVNNHSGGSNFTIGSGATLEFNNASGNIQQLSSGSLTGNGTLVKSGAGNLLFGASGQTQSISMTGGLIDVQGGTLRNEYTRGDWTQNLASLNVAAGATVDLWDSPGGITADALTGSGTVTHTSYGGTENFTIGVNNGSGTFAGTITNSANHALNLVKTGSGTQVLSGSDSYTGTTNINGGTISLTGLAANATIGAPATELTTTAITINAGSTLSADATTGGQNSHRISHDLTLNGGTLASNGVAGNNDWNFAFDNGSKIIAGGSTTSTISASIGLNGVHEFNVGSGSSLNITGYVGNWEGQAWGTINKTGPGTLILANQDGYGGLTLNGGTVSVAGWSNLSIPGYFADFESNSTFQFATGNTLDISKSGGTQSGGLKVADGVTATLDTNGNNVALGTAFVLGTNQSGAITKIGAGTLTISATNTFTGATTILGGTLLAGSATALSARSAHIVDAGGTLDLGGFSNAIGSLSDGGGAGGIVQNSTGNAATLTTGNDGTTTSYSGLIRDGTGAPLSILKTGSGTQTLSGTNTYTGGTTLNQGTLTVGTGGTLGASIGALSVNNTNSLTSGTNAVLNLATAVDTTVGSLSGTIATPLSGTNTATITNGGSGINFTVNQSVAGTYAGVIAGAGNLTLGSLSNNTLTLTGANTYSGATTISAGTLQIGGTGSLGSGSYAGNISNAGTLQYSSSFAQTLSGVISGAGALTKDTSSTSTLTLAGANTYTGVTTIGAGTLYVGNAAALPSASQVLLGTASTVGTLQAGAGLNIAQQVTLNGGGVIDANGQTVTLSNVTDGGGTHTLEATDSSGTGTVNLNGTQSYAVLETAGSGTVNVNAAIGVGSSTVYANATTNFTVSEDLDSLIIGGTAPALSLALTFNGGPLAANVPEPGSLGLLLVGALGPAARRRRA